VIVTLLPYVTLFFWLTLRCFLQLLVVLVVFMLMVLNFTFTLIIIKWY